MKHSGIINKMITQLSNVVSYKLPIGDEFINMNSLLGRKITLTYNREIYCRSCGNSTVKSFAQGYCYSCFKSIPETAPCILKPELCEAHIGIARDMKWAKDNCLQKHIVYLAVSSGLKVGVTRGSQIPTRWIDQGASKAIIMCETPNRFLAGAIEVDLKQYLSDKTSWQKMLKNEVDMSINLLQEKNKAILNLKEGLREYYSDNNEITEISYPVIKFPTKVKSINLDKDLQYSGKLVGIKGQYLIFEDEMVINIRKYGGYFLDIEY